MRYVSRHDSCRPMDGRLLPWFLQSPHKAHWSGLAKLIYNGDTWLRAAHRERWAALRYR
jgi:hypothetical protein